MSVKYFSLVLHSHIPYVMAHGNWPHGMDWLYEAAAESYLPLLGIFERLRDEGLPPRVNISFTPVLMEQLKSPSFATGFKEYLRMKVEIARKDRAYFEKAGTEPLLALTEYWENWYAGLLELFSGRYHEDIIEAFRRLQDNDQIEVLTSAATHGYFPLLSEDDSIRWQVRQGRYCYEKYFGRKPTGFWLPECAYRPGYAWKSPLGGPEAVPRSGVDEILGEEGLGCFFVDTHLLSGGEAKGVYLDRFPALKLLWEKFKKEYQPGQEIAKTPYLPYLAYPSKVPFLVRDQRSGAQVWSGKTGYPGDGWYLEFHKKHFPGGMRYWRITASDADLGDKLPYDPERVRERLEENAGHFVDSLRGSLKDQDGGVIVALYDTELFGHWWFEGPEWLYLVLKKLHQTEVEPQTASRCLEALPPHSLISLPEGSWGTGGFHWIWLNDGTAWIWEKIYAIEKQAMKLKSFSPAKDSRILKQFIREKFLLESSDWPFLISTWTARDYSENRAAEHYERARMLVEWVRRDGPLSPAEMRLLETWEEEDKLFSEVVIPDGRIV
ncbi:MAG: 1,4-alpha-glucan branching protein domain-containing protein [Candidatus Aminicenantales bacterium]